VLVECSRGYRYIEKLAFDGGSDFWGTCYSSFQSFVGVQGVQYGAGYVVVDFRGAADVHGVADYEFEAHVGELELGFWDGGF
jgi:hypothetical protein